MPVALPPYPGRGVIALRDADGELWWIYFLTGRSEASRDRALVVTEDRIMVVPTDERSRPDPLRHYSCVRRADATIVVGNGDHVDAITAALLDGRGLEQVLPGIDPEPDPPINTPRIAAALGTEQLEVLAVRDVEGTTVRSLETVTLEPGAGIALHTYGGGADPVTVDARPHPFSVDGRIEQWADAVWDALRPELRVALAVGRAGTVEPIRVFGRFDP